MVLTKVILSAQAACAPQRDSEKSPGPIYYDGDTNNTRWVRWGGSSNYLVGTFDDGRHFHQEGEVQRGELGTSGYVAQSWGSNTPDGRRIQISWMYTAGQDLSKKSGPLSLYVKGGTAEVKSLKVWHLQSIWPRR